MRSFYSIQNVFYGVLTLANIFPKHFYAIERHQAICFYTGWQPQEPSDVLHSSRKRSLDSAMHHGSVLVLGAQGTSQEKRLSLEQSLHQ